MHEDFFFLIFNVEGQTAVCTSSFQRSKTAGGRIEAERLRAKSVSGDDGVADTSSKAGYGEDEFQDATVVAAGAMEMDDLVADVGSRAGKDEAELHYSAAVTAGETEAELRDVEMEAGNGEDGFQDATVVAAEAIEIDSLVADGGSGAGNYEAELHCSAGVTASEAEAELRGAETEVFSGEELLGAAKGDIPTNFEPFQENSSHMRHPYMTISHVSSSACGVSSGGCRGASVWGRGSLRSTLCCPGCGLWEKGSLCGMCTLGARGSETHNSCLTHGQNWGVQLNLCLERSPEALQVGSLIVGTIFDKMIAVLTRYRPVVFELICSRNDCNFPRRRFFLI